MEKVEFFEVTSWAWECPCGQLNEEENDPGYEETIFCQNLECEKEFIPVQK